MRWVLITAFGVPVEPEVNRNFAMVSGVTAANAFATAGVSGVAAMDGRNRAALFDIAAHDRCFCSGLIAASAGANGLVLET